MKNLYEQKEIQPKCNSQVVYQSYQALDPIFIKETSCRHCSYGSEVLCIIVSAALHLLRGGKHTDFTISCN